MTKCTSLLDVIKILKWSVICGYDIVLFSNLQERRESSRSNREFKVDNSRLNDKQSGDRDSDTSEGGDSSRNHKWR